MFGIFIFPLLFFTLLFTFLFLYLMSDFYLFCQRYGIKKHKLEYRKGGRDFVSYGWLYLSPFRYTQFCPKGHEKFFRLVEIDKMISRVKSDNLRLKKLNKEKYDQLDNWKTRFGQVPFSGQGC